MKLFYNIPPSEMDLKINGRATRLPPFLRRFVKTPFPKIWEQADLPLGNGSLGLSVMGEVVTDRLVLNHKTLWSGGPSQKRPDYCGGNISAPDGNGKMPCDYYNEIREEFKKGNDKKAGELCEKLVGIEEGYGSYLCWGELNFADRDIKKYSEYTRALDMENALCTVAYSATLKNGAGVRDKREYFVSHPDKCAVIRLTRQGGVINTDISLTSAHGRARYEGDGIIHTGELTDNGLKYCMLAGVITDGRLIAKGDRLSVIGAGEIKIILSADTDYLDAYPAYRTGESAEKLLARVESVINAAKKTSYDELLARHTADFKELFSRVTLNLNGNGNAPAHILLKDYNSPANSERNRRTAEELLYSYGRYMIISSSREGDMLPANLQGIWNASNSPAWSSDFHLNVNLQMNYWHIYNGNTAECALPLIRYIKSLVVPGRLTAEYYTGVKSGEGEQNGFLFHTQNTPFGWTCPGWSFDWGWSPAAVPWILHNVYEYYEYTLDKEVLKNDIYPMLKESAKYFAKLLTEHNGRLVTTPCFSPEHGPRTMGNTYEQSLIWQLYDNAIHSAEALGVDGELAESWRGIREKLKPLEIGADGQIKEWYHEKHLGEMGQKHHRHMSHLLGLFPCNVMNKEKSPELVKAAVVSMNHRGDESTGWSMGQKINSWARVGDGDRVLKIIGDLFRRGIYPNFWDVHPPFQIDGNFGYASGVNEMLMQSHCGYIELLPALPSEWKNGSVTGLVARGNFTVSIEWRDGKLASAQITSNKGGVCRVCYMKSDFTVNGENISQNGIAEFATQQGETYNIKLL